MKIAICDDDNGACEELRKILENISTEKDMIHIYNRVFDTLFAP